MTSYADDHETSPSLGGGAIYETVATFEGCWGGQHRGYLPRTKVDLAIPVGAAICETVATFEGCWGGQRSDALRRLKFDLTIPGVLRSVKLSPHSRAAGGSSGVTSYADSN